FNDLKAQDVMTIRHEVFSLNGRRTVEDALPEILEQRYTRIPLYDETLDEITGVVYMRDLLMAMSREEEKVELQSIANDPIFVVQNQPLDELFAEITQKNRQIAMVVDEGGILVGVVSVEDLLEELVGEIYDESDAMPLTIEPVQQEGDESSCFRVDGRLELRQMEEVLGVEISGKPTDRVNYWILKHIERIPNSGEVLQLEGVEVEIEQATQRRIESILVRMAP
ncbi:MAG: CBS domain-containing protein, partial [Gammaproteobacteria bacterium]|nr:CBS domain-containing protein [Gammaproteobacteria bacterium]